MYQTLYDLRVAIDRGEVDASTCAAEVVPLSTPYLKIRNQAGAPLYAGHVTPQDAITLLRIGAPPPELAQPVTLTQAVDTLQSWQDGSNSREIDLHPNPVLGGYTAAALTREGMSVSDAHGQIIVWEFRAETLEEAILLLAREVQAQLALDFDGYISRDNEEDPLPQARPVDMRQILTLLHHGVKIGVLALPAGNHLPRRYVDQLAGVLERGADLVPDSITIEE